MKYSRKHLTIANETPLPIQVPPPSVKPEQTTADVLQQKIWMRVSLKEL